MPDGSPVFAAYPLFVFDADPVLPDLPDVPFVPAAPLVPLAFCPASFFTSVLIALFSFSVALSTVS